MPTTDLTDPTIIDAPVRMPLPLTSQFLFVVRPSVLTTVPSAVASLGPLPDLLNNGPLVLMDGTLLRSQMSMNNPSAKVATRATNVGTCVPALEPDSTDETVSHLVFSRIHDRSTTRRSFRRFRSPSRNMISIFYSEDSWGYSTHAQ